jgi:hypothetical protein
MSIRYSSLLRDLQGKEEPTSGLEPLTCSLRVRFEAFLGIARTCKTRLDKLDSLPSFAYHCT